jgi:maltodextrin utilization protein YvdJ
MQMTKLKPTEPVLLTALVIIAVFVVSFAVAPLAVAASSGSAYPMEIIRAHTVYKVADPTTISVGLGVHGER